MINKRIIKKLPSSDIIYTEIYETTTSSSSSTDVIGVSQGGTNITSYSIGDLIVATGTTILSKLSPSSTPYVLLSDGISTIPKYGLVDLSTMVSNILPAINGGTGISTYTTGDLIYASSSTSLSTLTDVAIGKVLIANGVSSAPSYDTVDLSISCLGVLPIANGGLNTNSLSAGTIISTTGTISSLTIGSAYNYLRAQNNILSFTAGKRCVQYNIVSITSIITCSVLIPYDNTIPQNTEGTQITTQLFQPTDISNTILIICNFYGDGGGAPLIGAIFTDSNANAIAAAAKSGVGNLSFMYIGTFSSTTAITYSFRIGPTGGGTFYLNANNAGSSIFGGTIASSIEFYELSDI